MKMINFEIWLEETKRKNLTFEDLAYEIGHCEYSYYEILEGFGSNQKAEILFALWKNEKPDDLSYLIPFLKENNIV